MQSVFMAGPQAADVPAARASKIPHLALRAFSPLRLRCHPPGLRLVASRAGGYVDRKGRCTRALGLRQALVEDPPRAGPAPPYEAPASKHGHSLCSLGAES